MWNTLYIKETLTVFVSIFINILNKKDVLKRMSTLRTLLLLLLLIIVIIIIITGGAGVWTQDLALARQGHRYFASWADLQPFMF
jgi:hypothetical protein